MEEAMRFAKRHFSEKWDALEGKFGRADLLPMWVADPDFEVSPKIYEAVKKLTEQKNYGYGYYPETLFERVIEWHKRRFGVEVRKEWIVFIPGVLVGIDIAQRIVSGPTIIQPPIYPPFFRFGEILNPLKDGKIDYEDLERLEAKKLLFCSPHNPTGRVWSQEELQKVAWIASKREWVVISDEIHADIAFDRPHTPFWTLYDKTIALYSPSKSFCIAGLSFAYAIIPDRTLRVAFKKAARFHSTNIFGIVATEAAYESEEWLEEFLHYVKRNRGYLHENLRFSHQKPEGTYLVWIEKEIEDFNQRVIHEAKVAPSFGEDFGDERYFRLNIATTFDIIREAVARLNKLKERG